MSGLYVSMIFIGIILVIVSLLLIIIDKKNIFVFKKSVDEKKRELMEVINDAEQMIEELNRFSGYIVDQMDLKNDELHRNITEAEQRITALLETIDSVTDEQPQTRKGTETYGTGEGSRAEAAAPPLEKETSDLEISAEKIASDTDDTGKTDGIMPQIYASPAVSAAAAYSRNSKRASSGRREKVIQFNKYQEVLRLSKEGMNELDIAKNLNMGKGEVELIIGLRRNVQ